jgi:hypothetical protein
MLISLKDATLRAARNVGNRLSGRKQRGLVAYLESLATDHPRTFVRLLEKAMRLEPPEKSADTAPPKSVDELRQTLRARGLPDHIYAQTDFKKR